MPRPRLILLAVAGAVIVAAAVAYWVLRPDTSPAPATKKALAAVAVEVLDIEPSSYEPNPEYDVPQPLGVVVLWHPGGSDDAHRLHLDVRSYVEPERASCVISECDAWKIDGGEIRLRWQAGHPEEDPGLMTVAYVPTGEDREERSVTYSGELITGDPRKQDDLPVSVDDLVGLVTDDRFASTTTQEMVDADLDKWPEAEARAAEAVPTTPQVVAQWLLETIGEPPKAVPADTTRYGDEAVGAEFRFRDRTTSVVIVPADSPTVPRCTAGWHCSEPRQYGFTEWKAVTGWRPGVARAWVRIEDRTVLATVRSPTIDRLPLPAWKHGNAGRDLDELDDATTEWTLLTTREVRDGAEDLAWFEG